ncbi:MAG: hypothetical protein [Caudoviricetes sp.]|nr:MAG: hypothetical protein [Caudoviricetes sp.]
MNELEIKKVPFLGTELMAARDKDGQIWAGVRWMCEGIGLSKGQMQNERLKIQKDKVLSKGERNFVLNESGYGNREALCLKLDFVPLWLAKISITPTMEAETPELAEKLIEYQLKAKDVLAEAFLPQNDYTTASKELQAIFMLDNRTVQHERRIAALEDSMVVDYGQQRTLAAQVNAVVITALGGKDSPAYHDKNVRSRTYSECNRDIQKWFRVNSRNNIPRKRFDEAIEYIQRWHPSTNMAMTIQNANQQTQI